MLKYTFYYRLNIRNNTKILNYCTIDENLKAAVAAWEKYKLTQHRVLEMIILIRVAKEKILN